jgi:ubiquinone/menaquinone biosynthesis C-methylase UbiE
VSKADRRAELQAERAADERAIDVGAGTGAVAFALAPRVREVVAVEIDPELAERARADAPPNVQVVVADGEKLPFEDFSFDVGVSARTLHHTPRPELLIAELTRVVRPGGTLLVVDQLAPSDPLAAFELNRFERVRDQSTTRILADVDLRGLFDANGLVLRQAQTLREPRDLERYLDLAGCEGADRDRARSLVPSGYEAVVGWFVLTRR